MSKVMVRVADGGWFVMDDHTWPEYGQLCIVVFKDKGRGPAICQYRKSDEAGGCRGDYFINMSEKWYQGMAGVKNKYGPQPIWPCQVAFWKPAGFPKPVDRQIKEEIRGWVINV